MDPPHYPPFIRAGPMLIVDDDSDNFDFFWDLVGQMGITDEDEDNSDFFWD